MLRFFFYFLLLEEFVRNRRDVTSPKCSALDMDAREHKPILGGDYGKYRFEQAKREKEARKNQRVVEIKEIRLSLNIDTHDFETKKNHAVRFLSEGNKVKVSIRFRGREMGHPELGADIMKRFAETLADVANVEKPAKLEGRNMLMFLAPKPVK